MLRRLRALPIVGVVALAHAPTHASAADEPEAENVTVRGSQSAGFTGRARLEDAPREVTDAASLVEAMPGVHVRRFGADDAFATLSIRGSTSTEVAILLAGVPLTGGSDPSLDLATLPLWPGARARVYRSFAPPALGPGSLGGTLTIDPPRASAPVGTEVWVAAGSFGARRMRAADVRALDDAGKTRLVTALSASRADDAFEYFDPVASVPGHDVTSTREGSRHAAANGLVSLALPVPLGSGREGNLNVTAMVQGRRQQIPGTIQAPTPRQTLDSNRELASIELAVPAARGAWSVRAWGRRDGLRLRDDVTRLSTRVDLRHSDDVIVAAGASSGWRGALGDDVTLEARADGSAERFAPGEYTSGQKPAGATRLLAGAALDVDWRATRAVTLSASGRADTWVDGSPAADVPTRGDTRLTGHVGSEVQVGKLVLAAHGGAVARPPSFVERFGDRGAFIGDPALRPEQAFTADAGARLAARAGRVSVRAELVGFGTWAEDLIVFVAQGAFGRARATNIGRARLLGVEAEVSATAFGLDLRVAYTGLATANEAACAAELGPLDASARCTRPPLPGRPTHDVVADLTYALGPLRIRYGVDALSGLVADLSGTVPVPPRVLQSAGVRLDVPGLRGVRAAVDVRNLFDVRTSTYDGALGPVEEPIGDAYQYPLPGRTVLASVRGAW
jgi:hypothetical protein